MNLTAKMVRGNNLTQAIDFLTFLPQKAGKILLKVVKSAAANAKNNAKQDVTWLYIKTIEVGKGRKLKRMRYVGRSRIHRYVKYRTNVTVILDAK